VPEVRRFKYGHGQTNHIKWTILAQAVSDANIYKTVPAVTFLLGKFEPAEKKERKERKRKEGPSEPLQTADHVNISELQEVSEDKAQVARMRVLLNTIKSAVQAEEKRGAARRVVLFDVVLHPTSFSQTVENFFDLAFLIKDGWVRLDGQADAPYLTDAKPPTTSEYGSGLLKTQNIMKLDHATYVALVAKWCKPGQPPLLPSRDSALDQPGGQSKKQRAS
jgi:hypothetical protein